MEELLVNLYHNLRPQPLALRCRRRKLAALAIPGALCRRLLLRVSIAHQLQSPIFSLYKLGSDRL